MRLLLRQAAEKCAQRVLLLDSCFKRVGDVYRSLHRAIFATVPLLECGRACAVLQRGCYPALFIALLLASLPHSVLVA